MIGIDTQDFADLSRLKVPDRETIPTYLAQQSFALETNLHLQELSHQGIDISLFRRPAPGENVSGDFIDIIIANERFSYLFFGDVAGHGEEAARISVDLHRLLRTWSFQGLIAHSPQPTELLLYLDSKISKYFPEWGVSMNIVMLDNTDLSATCASGGIYAPLLLQPGVEPKQLDSRGAVLGWNVFGEQHHSSEKVTLIRNDWLVMATDGILELPTRHGSHVLDDLKHSRTKIGTTKPKQLLSRLINCADASKVSDDQSIVIISAQACPLANA